MSFFGIFFGPLEIINGPVPSGDPATCQVYGYFQTANHQPAIGLVVYFHLLAIEGTELISRRQVQASTVQAETEGQENYALMTVDLHPGRYRVVCKSANIDGVISVSEPQSDLRELLTRC